MSAAIGNRRIHHICEEPISHYRNERADLRSDGLFVLFLSSRIGRAYLKRLTSGK